MPSTGNNGPNIFSPFLSEVFGFSEDEEKEKEEEPMNLVSALLNEMSSFVEKPDPNDDAEQLLQPSIPAQTHRSKHIPTLNTHYSGISLATILGEEVAGEIHKRKRGRPKGSMGKRRKKVEMRQIKMRERTKELEQGLIQQKQEETSQSIKKKRERLQRSREKMLQTLKVSNAKWEKERQLELSKKAVSDDDSLAFLISSNEENLLAFQEPLYTFRTRRQTPHPPQSLQTQKIGKLQRTLNPIGPKMKRRARRATPKLPPPDKAPRKDTEASQPPSQSLSQNESSDSLFKSSDHSPKITSPRPKTKRPQKAPKLAKNPVRFPPLSLPPQHTTPLTPPFVVPTTLTKLAPLPTTLLAHPSTLKPSSTFRMPTMNSHQLSFHSTLPRPLQSVSNKLNSSFHPPFLSGLPFPRLSPSERTRT
ncbi:hypothetical protein BLNAU_12943 [Blattamonas nauphoetae]|uniref:Uncharacterized protein n=1 Tax=Blattamonas nauphoetae TaxID=2049346 RepID=A0ABQ9XNA0_9EUKA|nr:hypothetical protein BLNAU_12943 [Blattamonas nauphoetae]